MAPASKAAGPPAPAAAARRWASRWVGSFTGHRAATARRMRGQSVATAGCARPNPACRPSAAPSHRRVGQGLVELAAGLDAPARQDGQTGAQGYAAGSTSTPRAQRRQGHHPDRRPHIGCFEMINQYSRRRIRLTAMYKPRAQGGAGDRIMGRPRARPGSCWFPPTCPACKRQLKALKKVKRSASCPTRWPPAATAYGRRFSAAGPIRRRWSAACAQVTGAAAFMVYAERLTWGRGYHIHVISARRPAARRTKQAAAAHHQPGSGTTSCALPGPISVELPALQEPGRRGAPGRPARRMSPPYPTS